MFTLPPRPPKDYVIKNVPKAIQTAPEHTPVDAPRVTQTTFAKYSFPIAADDNEPADKSAIEQLNDRVLENWAHVEKGWWVDKPGLDDYHLHDVYKKYTIPEGELDPRYQHRVKLFQRTYQYELDCIEERRVQKLKAKMIKEYEEELQSMQKYGLTEKPSEQPAVRLIPCKAVPPFWWQKEADVAERTGYYPTEKLYQKELVSSHPRWQKRPSMIAHAQVGFCERRNELGLCGQPFKHEACVWYFKNYPPPDIVFIPDKFSR